MGKRIVTALFAVVVSTVALADGAGTFAARCAACHGKFAEGTAMGPAIAGKAAPDVKHAIEVGGSRDHKPGTKWKMKPLKLDDGDVVAAYVAAMKK